MAAERKARAKKDDSVNNDGTKSDGNDNELSFSKKDLEVLVRNVIRKELEVFKNELVIFKNDLKSWFDEQHTLFETRLRDCEEGLNSHADRIVKIESTAAQLTLMPDIATLPTKDDLEGVRSLATQGAVMANDVEQYSRRANLRFRGLCVPPGATCLSTVISFINNSMHLRDITPNDIDNAHQVSLKTSARSSASKATQNDTCIVSADSSQATSGTADLSTVKSTILVCFSKRDIRDKIISSRKLLKGTNVSIVEDLTSLNVQLINRLRLDERVLDSWSWNGRVFAKLNNGKKVVVRPFQSITDIINNK